MPIPDQDQVKPILQDFEARLRRIVDQAWQEWIDTPDRGRFVFVARVRAVLIFDAIARLALAEFSSDPNIRALIGKQTVKFLFKGELLVRFKKGNAKGVGSNIATQAVLDFIDPQRNIPGLIPEILKVEICYQPDDLGTLLKEVAVVARDRHKRLWAYPLETSEPSAEVVPLPLRTPDETPPAVTPRRQPKEDSEEQQ